MRARRRLRPDRPARSVAAGCAQWASPSRDADLMARMSVARGRRDGLLTEPREPGAPGQQSVPYAPNRDPLDATQALQHLCRLLHAPDEWAPTLVVAHQGILNRADAGEFLGEDNSVDQSTVRSRAQVRGHGMGCVAEQDQATGEPAPTVDPAEGIDQQVVERRHPLQQVCCRGKYPSPLLAEGLRGRVEIPPQPQRPHGLQPKSRRGRHPAVHGQRIPMGSSTPRTTGSPDRHNRAYVAAPRRHPALESHPYGVRPN